MDTDCDRILAANAAWQLRLVEAFGICPFAKSCREAQRLWREVVPGEGPTLAAALTAALVRRHAEPVVAGRTQEVALLICPEGDADAAAFDRFVQRCAEAALGALSERALTAAYHVVAFHPEMAFSPADPHRLVGFWRRSPHPTVQMVHAQTLRQIQRGPLPPRYVDADDAAAVAALLGQTFSGDLADRIAQANWRTYHTDQARITRTLAELAAERG